MTMGFLDALTADAYARDSQGRRIFAPYGRRGRAYVLPDARTHELARFQRRWFQLYIVALLAAGAAVGPWAVLAVGGAWILVYVVGLRYVARGLEEASERPILPRDERVRRGMRVMGRPTMIAICASGAGSAIFGASLLLRNGRNLGAWFIMIYGVLVTILYTRQLTKIDDIPSAT